VPSAAETERADTEPPVAGRGAGWWVGEALYRFGVPVLLLVLVVVFSLISPTQFFTVTNLQNILGTQAILLMLALGLTIPLAAGEFDLSIIGVFTFVSGVFALLTVDNGWSLGPALVVALVLATAIGLINAFFIVRIGVNSFITTLGTGTAFGGATLLVTDSQTFSGLPEVLVTVSSTRLLGLPLAFYYAIALAIALWYVLEHTPVGRWLFFVGMGPEVARLNGIPVSTVRATALVLSALIAALAGMLQGGLLDAVDPFAGQSYLLSAFAGAFLGATTIKPGRFNSWGTVAAIYLVITGIVGLQITTGATGYITDMFNGTVLVVAVALSIVVGRRRSATPPGSTA
jgi:ribose transport system permease protein